MENNDMKPFFIYDAKIPQEEGDFGVWGYLQKDMPLGKDICYHESEKYTLIATASRTPVLLRRALSVGGRGKILTVPESRILLEGAIVIYDSYNSNMLMNELMRVSSYPFPSLLKDGGLNDFLFHKAGTIQDKDNTIDRILFGRAIRLNALEEKKERRLGIIKKLA